MFILLNKKFTIFFEYRKIKFWDVCLELNVIKKQVTKSNLNELLLYNCFE